jgi:hypothetical protein
VAKKRTVSRKPARAKSGATKRARSTADYSRLDTAPLQEHIKKRIKELEGTSARKSGAAARSADDTLKRLRLALDTLQDICEPTMTLPI